MLRGKLLLLLLLHDSSKDGERDCAALEKLNNLSRKHIYVFLRYIALYLSILNQDEEVLGAAFATGDYLFLYIYIRQVRGLVVCTTVGDMVEAFRRVRENFHVLRVKNGFAEKEVP